MSWVMSERILAIGAHPDDVEFGCSGMLQNKEDSHIIVLSRGGAGGFAKDRVQEAKNAAKILGAKVDIFSLPDTSIGMVEAAEYIEFYISTLKPDTVLTMSKEDTHQDHRTVYEATKIATRNSSCTILSYVTPSSAQDFHPTWFLPLNEEEMSIKLSAIACHCSQRDRSYLSEKYIKGMARYWAMVTRSKYEYVEPYRLIRYWENEK